MMNKILNFVLHGRLRFLLVLALVFFLPVSKYWIKWCLLFLISDWILTLRIRRGFFNLTYVGVFLLYYLYLWFSFTWSSDLKEAENQLSMNLSFVIFPFLFGIKERIKWDFKIIFEVFIYGCFTLMIMNYSSAFGHYYWTGDITNFFYSKLSPEFHVAYASMYCTVAIAASFYLYFQKHRYFKSLGITTGISLLFIIHIVLLNSKASFLGLYAVLGILFYYFYSEKKVRLSIVPFSAMVLVSFMVLFSSSHLYLRFWGGFEILKPKSERTISNNFNDDKEDKEKTLAPVESSKVRVVAYSNAWEIIQKNPFGVGIGDQKKVFLDYVYARGHNRFKEKELNVHNQFLQTMLAIGFPGLAILLLNIFYPLQLAWKKKNLIWFSFVAAFFVNSMFESMLAQQAGIVFYACFAVLIAKMLYEEDATSRGQQTLES